MAEVMEAVGLREAGRDRAKGYSLGMKQRLGLALALIGHPDVLLLDEPFNGLRSRRGAACASPPGESCHAARMRRARQFSRARSA